MTEISKIWKNSLVKSTFVYVISTFINSGIAILLLPILTRYLDTEEYGILSMINATVSVLIPFTGMSASSALERKLADNQTYENKKYLFNCYVVVSAATMTVSLIVLKFSEFISGYSGIPYDLLWCVVILACFDVLINIALSVLQFNQHVKVYALYRNGETLFNLGLSIFLVVIAGLSLKGRVYAILISKSAASLVGICLTLKIIGIVPQIQKKYITDQVANYGIPMIPTALKGTILNYMDRLFITNMKSLSETGLYSVGNQFSLPVLFLAQAFNMAYVPWLYRKLAENKEEDKRKLVKFTYFYFLAIIIIALFWSVMIGFVLNYIVGGKYVESVSYIIWLSLGYAFTGMHMMVVNYIYFMKRIKIYNLVTITVIASNIILNYVLIHKNGSIGAAQATLSVNVISFILTWILAGKIYKMPWFDFRN